MEKSRGDVVNHSPHQWEMQTHWDACGCLYQPSGSGRAAVPMSLPWVCISAKIPAGLKGLKPTGSVKLTILCFLPPFTHSHAAEAASRPSQWAETMECSV